MALSDHLFDTKFAGKLMLALQRAVASQFTETDWMELGYEAGEHEYIQGHNRLLRSLRFGDDDYGACVFQVLRYFSEQCPDALQVVIDNEKVRRVLERDAPDILSELGLNVAHVPALFSEATRSAGSVIAMPNVQGQGRCAALSRCVPCTEMLALSLTGTPLR